MSLSVDQIKYVLEQHQKGVSNEDIALLTHKSVETINLVILSNDENEYGRKSIRKFLIARRSVFNDWTLTREIMEAQYQYDRGLIELAQGRSKDYFFLYAFPRKVPAVSRQAYFSKRD